ncbi:nicotinamide n-methyltransferase [Boothiomyces macroporosus]|uniref:Nicotinamide n-methyltransferase n=1 Tax=Boothiomyces macroporosus TaxID=261099 RepID=A0AAD5Y3U3_9FUNG|nr:nicotinamide n-methyltransferase [Boothiomyces macroporosus]
MDDIEFSGFEEPKDFRPPSPEPTTTEFTRINGQKLTVHLPPKHSLWAHWLWNAGQSMTNYLDKHTGLYKDKTVLELGAAASLPSIICAINGGKTVISTDYPDIPLLKNILLNAKENIPELLDKSFFVKGYIWGRKNEHSLIQENQIVLVDESIGQFDLILLADLIFNHHQHENLLQSCSDLLSKDGICLVTFSHHNPQWVDRDMAFFENAGKYGLGYEKLYEERWSPMFKDDVGNEQVRSTVYGYKLFRI